MTNLQLTIFITTTIYLITQSLFDMATKKVPVIINNIALVANVVCYLLSIQNMNPIPILELLQTVLICIIIVCLSKYAHWYGIGDAKAMIVMLFSLRFASSIYPEIDIFMFLIAMFVADLLFLVFYKICEKFVLEKSKRHAFFPFLTIGYFFTYLLGILCY